MRQWTYADVMTKSQLTKIGAIATIGGAIVTIHGTTSGHWKRAHTLFSVVAALAGVFAFVLGLRKDDVTPDALAVSD